MPQKLDNINYTLYLGQIGENVSKMGIGISKLLSGAGSVGQDYNIYN